MSKEKNNMTYIRLCEGVQDVGKLIPADQDISRYIQDQTKDYYTSVFEYSEEHKKRFEERNSVAGIRDVTTNSLIFDFDHSENPQRALEDSVTIIERLNARGITDRSIEAYFSGSKGFHVVVNTQQRLKPLEAKNVARKLADGLETFDSVVYNSNRILRVVNTKHPKTGLYKIQLEPNALKKLTLDEIKSEASSPKPKRKKKAVHLPQAILNLKEHETKNKDVSESTIVADIDLSQKPANLSTWKYALSLGYFPVGQRSNSLDILARTYRGQGFNKNQTFHLLKAAAEMQSQRFDAEEFDEDAIWNTIIEQVYGPNHQGGTYAEENFPLALQKYLKEDLGLPMIVEEKLNIFNNTKEVFSTFADFAKNIDKNTIQTGIKQLDENVRMTTGMLAGLLGAPSSAKTTVTLEILKNMSKKDEPSIFFSMDMGASLVYQRMAQKVTDYSADKIFDIFKNNEYNEQEKIAKAINEQYGNVEFSFKTALNVESMYEAVQHYEQKTGKKVRLVAVDYLECIHEKITDPTAKISMISQKLKDMANDLDVCVLLLLQPPKRVGDPSKPILSYTDIKGASTVAQACSVVTSIWREGFSPKTPENDRYISFGILKNRFGQLSQVDCSFKGRTGEIGELDQIGKMNLQQLREMKDEEIKEENNSWF